MLVFRAADICDAVEIPVARTKVEELEMVGIYDWMQVPAH